VSVVAVDDRIVLERFFRRRPGVHAYELGDLDDFFWPHTRWFAWHTSDRIGQIVLLYDEPDPPVLLALAEDPDDEMRDLLRAIAPGLPGRAYAHLSHGLVDALAPSLLPTGTPVRHLKLDLVEPQRLGAVTSDGTVALSASDLAEVAAFYERAYPDTWFQARMLETGRYVGIRREGELVCVAGVHVWSPRWRVACLGNVATLPVARGTGLATTACAQLCRVLLADGIDVVSLNVRADNAAAIRTYEKLGFAHAADYVEVMLGAGSSRAARS
jgi:ribosomal protein S18 acetylase RimI-like enzyme